MADRHTVLVTKSTGTSPRANYKSGSFEILQAVNSKPSVPKAIRSRIIIRALNKPPEPLRRRIAVTLWSHMYRVPIAVNFLELAIFVLISAVIFAALLWASPYGCCNNSKLEFADHFDFAFQTVSAIGYGVLHPVGIYANFWVFWMGIMNICWFGLTGGILYAKFTKTPVKLRCADVLVLHNITESQVCLQLRIATASHENQQLVGVSVRLQCQYSVEMPQVNGKRSIFKHTEELQLMNPNPRIDGVLTVSHLVESESALFGLTLEDMAKRDIWLNLIVTGRDRISRDVLVFEERFQAADIMVGYRYRDMLEIDGNTWTFDYGLLSEVDPCPVWYPKRDGSEAKGHAEDQTRRYVPLEIASDPEML